jgi:hypothetical protein
MNFYLSQLQEQIHNEYSAAFSEINWINCIAHII